MLRANRHLPGGSRCRRGARVSVDARRVDGAARPAGGRRAALGMPLTLRFAGAESNFAIALARLGIDVAWISKLGRDPFGDLILAAVAGEGVETRWVLRDDAPTGLFCKWRAGGRSHVTYRRAGSAASRLQVGDVPDEALDGVQVVHLTGITMAISESARELVLDVARRAKERGATVVFDPNFRPALPGHARGRGRSAASGSGARRLVPLRRGRGRAPLAGRRDPGPLGDPRRRQRRDRRRRRGAAAANGVGRRRDRRRRRVRRRLRLRPAGRAEPGRSAREPATSSPRVRWPAPATGRRSHASRTCSADLVIRAP